MKRKRYAVMFILADENEGSLRSEWDDRTQAGIDFADMVDGIVQTDDVRSFKEVYVLDRKTKSKTFYIEFDGGRDEKNGEDD